MHLLVWTWRLTAKITRPGTRMPSQTKLEQPGVEELRSERNLPAVLAHGVMG